MAIFSIVEQYSEIEYDIAFGGTFYAYADISQFGINFNTATIEEVIKASMALTKAAALSVQPIHPELKEASYIGGTILYDSTQMNQVDVSQKFVLVYGNCHVSNNSEFKIKISLKSQCVGRSKKPQGWITRLTSFATGG